MSRGVGDEVGVAVTVTMVNGGCVVEADARDVVLAVTVTTVNGSVELWTAELLTEDGRGREIVSSE